jgi:pimeloyl-ACP methyl ester carboxylesterase
VLFRVWTFKGVQRRIRVLIPKKTSRTLMSTLTYEAWNHIPSAYILCLKDKSIPLKQVREVIKRANIEMVLEVDSGHTPHLSEPKLVEEFIRKAAGEEL